MGARKLSYYNEEANFLGVFSKKEVSENFFSAQKSVLDYYPFGMLLPNRHESTSAYRYGFNGYEKDDEVSGEGNSLNSYFRQYDPRLGRFKSIDPMSAKFPWQSPYVGFDNNPILLPDPTGGETEDFWENENGDIIWHNASGKIGDEASLKDMEGTWTNLGKELSFNFTSYIDKDLWDGPLGDIPTGDKLISTITFKATANANGDLIKIEDYYKTSSGPTPVGTPRMFYPGEGGKNNQHFGSFTKNSYTGVIEYFDYTFEQHSSVSYEEEFGLHRMGFNVVDVAQKLELNYYKGILYIDYFHDVFPSVNLQLNNKTIYQYDQPSFLLTHTAPIIFEHSFMPLYNFRNFSYYPVKLFFVK